MGGGSAGLAAGVASSRAGAETRLFERHGFLGGMATAALVHSVCGLYRIRETPGAEYANGGFPREFAERLIASGASPGPVRMGRLDVLPHDPSGFARAADAVVAEERNLAVRFHTEITQVERSNEGWTLHWMCRGRSGTTRCQALVDASGDAVAATLAHLPLQETESFRFQRPAYVVGLHGIDEARLDSSGKLELAGAIARAIREGRLPADAAGAHFRGTGVGGTVFCTVDLPGGDGYDPANPDCLSQIETRGRELAFSIVELLRRGVPGLERLRVAFLPARAGVRESRRLVTRHVLTGEELLSGAEFPDRIAYAAWPMENREKATGPRWKFPEPGRMGQIPLRALRPEGLDHFFVAGRCLGATHEAQAAIRVMGTCLATGEAAGRAAATRGIP